MEMRPNPYDERRVNDRDDFVSAFNSIIHFRLICAMCHNNKDLTRLNSIWIEHLVCSHFIPFYWNNVRIVFCLSFSLHTQTLSFSFFAKLRLWNRYEYRTHGTFRYAWWSWLDQTSEAKKVTQNCQAKIINTTENVCGITREYVFMHYTMDFIRILQFLRSMLRSNFWDSKQNVCNILYLLPLPVWYGCVALTTPSPKHAAFTICSSVFINQISRNFHFRLLQVLTSIPPTNSLRQPISFSATFSTWTFFPIKFWHLLSKSICHNFFA